MNDLIKYGLLAVGGWLLYSKFASAAPVVAAPATGVTPPVGTPPVTTPPAKPPVVTTPPLTPPAPGIDASAYCAIAKKVLLAAGPGPMNADNWNYYWTQASGQTQIVDLFPPGNRDAQLTFDQYLVNRQTAGVGIPIPDCTLTTREQPGPQALAGFGAYTRIGRGYVRSGTPMRMR
jgi:hypothetical protein